MVTAMLESLSKTSRRSVLFLLLPFSLLFLVGQQCQDTDADGDGVPATEDCNDNDPTIFPGAPELCDYLDNNCDGVVDDGALITFYADRDMDGFGTSAETIEECIAPDGYVDNAADCDDKNPTVNPAASELCDGIDNNCDGAVDVDAVDAVTWYADADKDGYGSPTMVKVACDQPRGYVDNDKDCNDRDVAVNPDAVEGLRADPDMTRCDGIDNDCDGMIDEGYDRNGDGIPDCNQ